MSDINYKYVRENMQERLDVDLGEAGFDETMKVFLLSELVGLMDAEVKALAQDTDEAHEKAFVTKLLSHLPVMSDDSDGEETE